MGSSGSTPTEPDALVGTEVRDTGRCRICCVCQHPEAAQEIHFTPRLQLDKQGCVVADRPPLVSSGLSLGGESPGVGLRASLVLEGVPTQMDRQGGYTPSSDSTRASEEPEEPVCVSRNLVHERADMGTRQSITGRKPDFSGSWKMIQCDGDFDGFMKEMGVSWAFRKAAQAVGYGVNATFHKIQQEDLSIIITTENPKGTFVKNLRIDGSEQDDVDPLEKKPIKVVPYWETRDTMSLTLEAFMPMPDGKDRQMPVTRRYLKNGQMIVEQTSPKGIVIRRVFTKQ